MISILLTELNRSVWENLDLGRVKILPYRPPARLIRANLNFSLQSWHIWKSKLKNAFKETLPLCERGLVDNWDSKPPSTVHFIGRCEVIAYNWLLSQRKSYKFCVCCRITQFALRGLVRRCLPQIPALQDACICRCWKNHYLFFCTLGHLDNWSNSSVWD